MLRIVTLVFPLSRHSFASEPQCSRFHYEEKTLEKIIKLELFVHKMKADIDAIEKRVADTLRDLGNEREELKLQLENEREITKKELKEMKEMTRAEIQKAEEVIKNVTDSSTTPTVVFSVKEPVAPSTSQIIIYGDIIMNEGTGYDTTTGIFTAPVAGVYMFTVQFCTPVADGIGFAVVSKKREIKRGWMRDTDDESCRSSDAVDVLSKGDRVWIKCTNSVALPQGDSSWNTFSGVLLHK